MLATEDRIVRAFGSADDIAALDGRHRRTDDAVTVVAVIAHALLGGGALLALVRLARGPSLLDRVVATDTLLVIISASLAVHAALERDPTVVPVLVVVSLLAFVGSVSIARYVGGMLLQSAEDPSAAGRRGRGDERADRRADVVALGCLLAGAFLCLTAGLGLVRFPDVLSRMHAGTKPQVLGVLLVMVGGAIRLQGWPPPGCCCWSRPSSCSPRRSART